MRILIFYFNIETNVRNLNLNKINTTDIHSKCSFIKTICSPLSDSIKRTYQSLILAYSVYR